MTQTPNRQTCLHRLLRWSAFCSLIACFTCQLFANTADTQMKTVYFDVPKGKAISTLTEAARQADMDIVFAGQMLRKVETPAVKGEYLPQEVFDLMLAGTSLAVFQHEKSGVYTVRNTLLATNANGGSNIENAKPMNDRKQSIGGLFKGLLALAAASSPEITAQDSGEQVFELSPFSVSGEDQTGYRATSTLAGTRIKTNLSDIATSISVVTEELLNDTNSTNAQDILVYTTGTEVSGIGGNFTAYDTTGSSVQINDEGVRNSIQSETRIRGLASADRARDYFRTSIPFDSYNTSSIEINRGSNAVLFGLGSPAGIINNSLKQAVFSDVTDFGVTFGSYGSQRATFDINREVIDNELAIRVIGMHHDKDFRQKPAFQQDNRIYGALKYQKDLFEGIDSIGSSTFRISFEEGEQDANRPRSIPVSDLITNWFEPWDVDVFAEYDLPRKITWNPYTHVSPRDYPRNPVLDPSDPYTYNKRLSHVVTGDYYRNINIIFDDPRAVSPISGYGGNIIGNQGTTNGTDGTRVFYKPADLNTALREVRPGLPYTAFWSNPVISDRSLFDYQNLLIDGPSKSEDFDFDVINVAYEQLLLNDKVGFEIAFAKESISQEYEGLFDAGERNGLTVDISTHLFDGSPNPNFGRPYINGRGYWGGLEEDRDVVRVTAFGEIDFRENDNRFMRWLGKHTLTGLFSDSSEEQFLFNGMPLVSGIDNIWSGNTSIGSTQGRWVGSVHYLAPSIADRNSSVGINIPNIQAYQIPSLANTAGGLYRLSGNGLDNENAPVYTGNGVLQDVSVSMIENAVNSATKTSRNVESLAFVLQSSLLNDILISTVSWRQDDLNSRARGAPERDASGVIVTDFPLIDGNPLLSKVSNVNYGAVLKTPSMLLEKVPGVSGLSFHYTESQNFQPARSRYNPDGSVIGSPSGETTDYGLSLSLFENKFVLRATKYETLQSKVTAPGVGSLNAFANWHGGILNYTLLGDNPNLDPSDPGPEFDFNGDGIIDLDYQDPPQDYLDRVGFSWSPETGTVLTGGIPATAIQDLETKGVEFELIYNPTTNWNIMFNAYQQEAISNNAASTFREFVNTPAYDMDGDGILETDWETAFTETYADIVLSTSQNSVLVGSLPYFNSLRRVEALDGQLNPELREWRFNVITNYRFGEGRFKGFNVGGAVRWEDEASIGYPLVEIADGEYNIDVTRPFYGDYELNVDSWVGYQREIMNGRANWKIQLNVRNLLNDQDLIPIRANPDGSEIAWRIPQPLEWSLRNTFSF